MYKATTERQKREVDFFCFDEDVPPLIPRGNTWRIGACNEVNNSPLSGEDIAALHNIPDECIIHIMSYILSPKDLLNYS